MGAGSDAHVLQGVGTGALRMRAFRDPEEFLVSLRHRRGAAPAEVAGLPAVAQVGGSGQGEGPLEEKDPVPPCTAVTTDEIYERYLEKAITEINRLPHEIVQAADGGFAAQPTGHPLADIFLLKYGAADAGAAGGRRLPRPRRATRSSSRCSDSASTRRRSTGRTASSSQAATSTLAADWLRRELRIVEPKLIVVMGDDALEFLNGLGFPLSRAARGDARRAAALHADDRGARRARHRLVARREPDEDRLLERLQAGRPLVGRAAALLGVALFAAARRLRRARARISGTRASGGTSRGSRSS